MFSSLINRAQHTYIPRSFLWVQRETISNVVIKINVVINKKRTILVRRNNDAINLKLFVVHLDLFCVARRTVA